MNDKHILIRLDSDLEKRFGSIFESCIRLQMPVVGLHPSSLGVVCQKTPTEAVQRAFLHRLTGR